MARHASMASRRAVTSIMSQPSQEDEHAVYRNGDGPDERVSAMRDVTMYNYAPIQKFSCKRMT